MRNVRPWKSKIFRHMFALCEGLLCVLVGGLALSGIILLSGNPPAWVMVWLSHVLWSVGSFCAGRCSGMHGRHHGLTDGILCGLLMGIVLFCGAVRNPLQGRLFVRLILMLICGGIGGIVGVNTKLKKSPD
ncbi:MAG TPA: TIGR04086 family membrane protein [Ruminococcus sp.]|nr:TIGR04086 family membrane protein [Ruminococcus sp.]